MSDTKRPNPFLSITPDLQDQTRKNLLTEIEEQVEWLEIPGRGEEGLVRNSLDRVQTTLAKFREFGWPDVAQFSDFVIDDLVEAIAILKRRRLGSEIRRIMEGELGKCNLPRTQKGPKDDQPILRAPEDAATRVG